MKRRSLTERFWSKVDMHGPDECWPWLGCTGDKRGYGRVWVSGRLRQAHHIAWELTNGPLPEGKLVRHIICDTPRCCNPAHLLPGTQKENRQDAVKKGRTARGDQNGARTHPEKRHKGEQHWSRIHPEWIQRGEQQGGSKLTEPIVIQIRQRYAAGGVYLRTLAREYSVSITTIWSVIRRRSWRHIAGPSQEEGFGAHD